MNREIAMLGGLFALMGCGSFGVDDGPGLCEVSIHFDPSAPMIDDTIRASAVVTNVDVVSAYDWQVFHDNQLVNYAPGAPDGSAIDFIGAEAGPYEVRLQVEADPESCPAATSTVTVQGTGDTLRVRLHINPPSNVGATVLDRAITVTAKTDYTTSYPLEAGRVVDGFVRDASTAGIAAYLRFVPHGGLMPDATIEAISDPSGAYRARLLAQSYDVLVVPLASNLAARRVAEWNPGSTGTPQPLIVDAGTAITGRVLDPSGAAVSGAWVQLTIDGVPSSLANTAGDGTFSVLGRPVSGAVASIEVTAPKALGLPRIEAADVFDVSQPLEIRYSPSLVLRNVVGTQVKRGGPIADAKVAIVGSLSSAATVTAGATSRAAAGYVRANLTANGSGNLPSALVPAGPLSAVVTVAPGDLAVAAFNTSASVPTTIDAPAMVTQTTSATALGNRIVGATLTLVPLGALALAGAPERRLVAEDGDVVVALASGGTYDVRWYDPSGAGGARVFPGVAALDRYYSLPGALQVRGEVTVLGEPNRVVGASVQILCGDCTGVELTRPIAETASDIQGQYVLYVPDPASP
jgi:hypothetical protein